MKIALAYPLFPKSIQDGLLQAEKHVKAAADLGARIICFPESYLPGYPAEGYGAEKSTPENMKQALGAVSKLAAKYSIAVIMPMDWYTSEGFFNIAYVISAKGELLGHQTKNQLDPTEDSIWLPGTKRQLFEVEGLKFGITICHEGFRYPESVRWAAQQGAQAIFHPHCAGTDEEGSLLTEWGNKNNPYYEKAMMMRALENTIYFASANYGFRFPESGSAIIAPDGTCLAHQEYGKSGIVVADIELGLATGVLAKRFKGELYY